LVKRALNNLIVQLRKSAWLLSIDSGALSMYMTAQRCGNPEIRLCHHRWSRNN